MKNLFRLFPLIFTCLFISNLFAQPPHVEEMKREKELLKKEREYERKMRKAEDEYYREIAKDEDEYYREMLKADKEYYKEMLKADREAYKEYLKARKKGQEMPPRRRGYNEYEYDDDEYGDDEFDETTQRRPENEDFTIEGEVKIKGKKRFPWKKRYQKTIN